MTHAGNEISLPGLPQNSEIKKESEFPKGLKRGKSQQVYNERERERERKRS